MPYIEQLGQQMLSTATNSALGGIFGSWLQRANDRRQLKQQQRLQDMQIKGNKEMVDYNMMKELEMWNNTNYSAQMKHLKDAGLNPGLLYGMKGGGGITTGSPGGGGVSGGQAPAGGREIQDAMTYGLQSAQLQANIDLTRSQTELNKTEAAKKKGIDTKEAETRIESLTQGIENQKAVEELTKVQTRIAKLEETLKGETLEDSISMAMWNERQAAETLDKLARENVVDKATMNDRIDLVKEQLTAQILMNEIHRITPAKYRSEIAVNLQQLQNMAHQIVQEWRKIEIAGTQTTSEDRRKWSETIHNETKLDLDIINRVIDGFILKSIISPSTGHKPVSGFHNR